MMGVSIEAATERVEVVAFGRDDAPLARQTEPVGHGHTRRLTPLVREVLERARLDPSQLSWVAADLGPGSFTGVRVGLATAKALAMVSGATLHGASSLVALALSVRARKTLVVPLVPAGRRDLYGGYFRADGRGLVRMIGAPDVAPVEILMSRASDARAALEGAPVRFIGPGVPRVREQLEQVFPGSTEPAWRFDGLSAVDLAHAARATRGPVAGLALPGTALEPLYVRPAQAEDRVRKGVHAAQATSLRPFAHADLDAVAAIEQRAFSDPWPKSFFAGELGAPLVYAMVAEREGKLAGYSMAWLGHGTGHLGNLAVAPDLRRRGVARALLEDLLEHAHALEAASITLEVRVSNFSAQWLYRAYGFRVVGVRPRYYRDTGEDAAVMEWRDPRAST